jgi:ribosomal protein L11 methyltransferase
MTAPGPKSSLRWLEARVQAEGEAAEAISELFNRLGTGGAVLEELVADGQADDAGRQYWIKAYLPVHTPEEEAEQRRRIAEGLWHLAQLRELGEPEFRLLADEDWAEAWKASYKPLSIGRRVVIKPSWCEWQAQPGQIVIELDPGQAFGTGLHPSTQLCLLGLEDYSRPAQTVLDLGTGSGILAIVAARLGAGRILAVDIDPLAVEVAEENVRLNGVWEQIVVAQGSLPPRDANDRAVAEAAGRLAPAGFDLMLVNILAEVIVEMLRRDLARWLAPGGVMITAGIIRERQALVESELAAAGLAIIERRQQGDWISLVAQKSA